jgi:hypothetical protein
MASGSRVKSLPVQVIVSADRESTVELQGAP